MYDVCGKVGTNQEKIWQRLIELIYQFKIFH